MLGSSWQFIILQPPTAKHKLPKTCGPEQGRLLLFLAFAFSILFVNGSCCEFRGISPWLKPLPYLSIQLCGPGRGRTAYLYIANVAFSQLNFRPVNLLLRSPNLIFYYCFLRVLSSALIVSTWFSQTLRSE